MEQLPNLLIGFISLIVIIIFLAWGCWELIDWLFVDDAIRVSKPLVPELELTVKGNVVDTVYVYRIP